MRVQSVFLFVLISVLQALASPRIQSLKEVKSNFVSEAKAPPNNEALLGLEDLSDEALSAALTRTLVRVRRGDGNDNEKCRNRRRRPQGYGNQGYGGGSSSSSEESSEEDRRCRKDMGYQMRKKIYKKAKMVMEMMKAMDGYPPYGDNHDGGYGHSTYPEDNPYGYFL